MKRLTFECEAAGIKRHYVTEDDCHDTLSVPGKYEGPAVELLAAYEDTGLTPEEVTDLQQAWDMYGGEDGITAVLEELERRRMKSCEECINRVFCPVYGESCFRHNDEEAFWQFLAMIAPSVKWDKVREASRRLREEGER